MSREEAAADSGRDGHPARLWTALPGGDVQCQLSPRNCVIADGESGYCQVRVNDGGLLRSLRYGLSLAMTDAPVEAAAVHHFAPGTRTLSLGHPGSAVDCAHCHGERTSRRQSVAGEPALPLTPEAVVEEALARGVHTICWTYHDPVVRQEFVLDTAVLAREYGILNVYASAFYVSRAAATELADVIEVFSISTRPDPVASDQGSSSGGREGRLTRVLDAAEYVFRRGRHVEISHLVPTGAAHPPDQLDAVAERIVATMSADVPLHLAGLPTGTQSVGHLERARDRAVAAGVRYCYLDTVPGHPAANSYCPSCGAVVVERYGMRVRTSGLSQDSACVACGEALPFRPVIASMPAPVACRPVAAARVASRRHRWGSDGATVDVDAVNRDSEPRLVSVKVLGGAADGDVVREVPVAPQSRLRLSCGRSAPDDLGVLVEYADTVDVSCRENSHPQHLPGCPEPGDCAATTAPPRP